MIDIAYELALSYQSSSQSPGPGMKPLVNLRISVGSKYLETAALVDSGADYSIFPAEIAQALGLNLVAGRQIRLIGLDGGVYLGYLHHVTVRLLGAPSTWPPIRAEVIFRENHPKRLGNLLGRHDFFRALKVGFDETKQTLYLGTA